MPQEMQLILLLQTKVIESMKQEFVYLKMINVKLFIEPKEDILKNKNKCKFV